MTDKSETQKRFPKEIREVPDVSREMSVWGETALSQTRWQKIVKWFAYHPEKHYMRGEDGPASMARNRKSESFER